MTDPYAVRFAHLGILTKKRFAVIAQEHVSLQDAWNSLNAAMLRMLGCRQDTVEKTMIRMEETDWDAVFHALEDQQIQLITIADDSYPSLLKEVPDAPVFLFVRGNIAILKRMTIGMVGTRAMTSYGQRVTELFADSFVRHGITTVSGLAEGIDAHVAKKTLEHSGKTVAVLGHGLGMIYPRANKKLADQIIDSGGLLISELPMDYLPSKYSFPARNRIIAGLSKATVVMEAAKESGSLITAELAFDYDRPVFAVPGQIFDENYTGCHQLLAKDIATVAADPEAVLKTLGIVTSTTEKIEHTFDDPTEQILYDALSSMPQSIDDLQESLTINASTMNATLTMLELKGAVERIGEGKWVRS